MLNEPEPDGTILVFSDCSSQEFYYNAVRWASSSQVKIVNGYGDGTFGPNDFVINEDLLTILYRFASYCGYITSSSTVQANYEAVFARSTLINKGTFSDYSEAAVGWAYQTGFLSDYRIQGKVIATRGEVAKYIYHFYKRYQKKYGLVVVNTHNMDYAANCGTAMKALFAKYGATVLSYQDINNSEFNSKMELAFQNAKALDICYLYFLSHGNKDGLRLFADNVNLTPLRLRRQIDTYKGTFIAFIAGCYTGTFIVSSNDSNTNEETDLENSDEMSVGDLDLEGMITDNNDGDVFDAQAFVNELVGVNTVIEDENNVMSTSTSDLSGSNRIKVICSSYYDEKSYASYKNATYYWCLGSGYNLNTGNSTSLYADSDSDSRISLFELYVYSYNQVIKNHPNQHIVHHPYGDEFIIFESGY